MAANAKVYNSHGKKYQVPRRRVYSLAELKNGDHIAFHQLSGSYWHHAIVEHIRVETAELEVIEYSNTAKEFLNNNCFPPRKLKDIRLAKVVRGRYNLQSEVVHLMLHEHCLDPATVVQRARSKLGEEKYCPLTNNCEHFAMWCKTGKSSSDQVEKAAKMLKKQVSKAVPCGALAAVPLGKTATSTQIVTTGVRVVTKKIVTQTVTKVGEEAMKTGVTLASKEVVGQTVSTVGKEAVKTGVRMASKEIVTQSVSSAGQEVVKTGVRMASKEIVTQSVSSAGQEVVKTGVRMASKEIVTQSVSSAGQEVVKTGVRMASKEIVTQSVSSAGQEVVKTGIRTATKEVLEETVSTAGKEVVKTASSVTTTTTTNLTQSTTKSVSNSAALGVACGALFEGISTVYDIRRAHEDMKKGNMTRKEFDITVCKRVVTGFGSFGGSTLGTAVGQAAIPIPFVGGLIGSVLGGLAGSLAANDAVDDLHRLYSLLRALRVRPCLMPCSPLHFSSSTPSSLVRPLIY